MALYLGTKEINIPFAKAYLGDVLKYKKNKGIPLKDLPVGAKIVDNNSLFNGIPVVWIVGEHEHYGSGQTVLISEKVLQFMPFDGKEASGGATNRNNYGNSNYPVSNIDQWLNSDADANVWFTAQHTYDQSPSSSNVLNNYNAYDNKPGFLNGFSAKFKNSLIEANLPYTQPLNEGETMITVPRKVFLPSVKEIGGSEKNEGNIIEYFKKGVAGAYPTSEAVANADYSNSKYIATSVMAYYWLRTCRTNFNFICYLQEYNTSAPSPNAAVSGTSSLIARAYHGTYFGVRPLVNINSNINVSYEPNSDGIYEIV